MDVQYVQWGSIDVHYFTFGYAAVDSTWSVVVAAGTGAASMLDSVVRLLDWNHRMKCGTSAEIELAIVLSTTNVGIDPPGLLDVAMRHSVFPLGSSEMLSTLT